MPLSAAALAGIGVAGDVIGGLFGKSGQSSANAANLRIARENRGWQERMSNTAYQRSAKDLDAAGLNRILAIGSPSTTPAGNVATMQNENAPLQQGIEGGIGKAIMAATAKAQIRSLNTGSDLKTAQAKAIDPAAEIGEGIGEIVTTAKQRAGSLVTQAKQNAKWGPPAAKATMTPSLQKRAIQQIAKSVGLNPQKAEELLLKTINKMDLPAHWTKQQKLDWALKNPERVKAYIARQR